MHSKETQPYQEAWKHKHQRGWTHSFLSTKTINALNEEDTCWRHQMGMLTGVVPLAGALKLISVEQLAQPWGALTHSS